MTRAAAYIRVSTSNRSRHGDELSFDQIPRSKQNLFVCSSPSGDGARIGSILTGPAARRKVGPASMH